MEKALAKMRVFKAWVEDKVEDHDDRLDDYDERLMMLEQANGITSYKQPVAYMGCNTSLLACCASKLTYVHVDANIKR